MPFSPQNPHPAAPTTTIASERRDGGSPVLKTLSSSSGLLPFRKALVRIPIICHHVGSWILVWFLIPLQYLLQHSQQAGIQSLHLSLFFFFFLYVLLLSTIWDLFGNVIVGFCLSLRVYLSHIPTRMENLLLELPSMFHCYSNRTCELRFLVNESSGEWILLVSTLKICFSMNNLIVFIALRYSSHCSQVLKAFHYPFTITAVQFAVGSVLVLFMWGFNLYKRPKISGAQTLELWYFSENKTISILAHDNTVFSLAASNATGLVASASHDKVKLWK